MMEETKMEEPIVQPSESESLSVRTQAMSARRNKTLTKFE